MQNDLFEITGALLVTSRRGYCFVNNGIQVSLDNQITLLAHAKEGYKCCQDFTEDLTYLYSSSLSIKHDFS